MGKLNAGQMEYICEINQEVNLKDKEIERLKQGYCPIKEKCNKGECDCTNEEYNQMCEENTKLDLEIERLKEEYKITCEQKNKYINTLEQGLNNAEQEIERLNNKLKKIEALINRTPRQTPTEVAYVWLKAEIAKVIGDDKK